MSTRSYASSVLVLVVWALLIPGCRSPGSYRREADKVAADIVQQKQQQTLGQTQPFTIERPADTLRRRLMIDQNLAHSSPASLGTQDLKPSEHWPKDDYLTTSNAPPDPFAAKVQGPVLRLSLMEALQVAAHNSREYQARKENIYLDALDLDLARDEFRTIFSGGVDATATTDLSGDETVSGVVASPQAGFSQKLKNGAVISSRIAMDLAKLLTGDHSAAQGLAADVSISLPLLRGAGEHIVTEPLTQAERNVAYDLLEFEQYKRTFAVNVASQYLAVLQDADRLQNAEDGYRRIIVTTRYTRRRVDAGRVPGIQVDQALQEELRARDSWITARQRYAQSLDSFKVLLGLPPDVRIELDREELQRLARTTEKVLQISLPGEGATTQPAAPSATQPTTQPVPAAEPTESATSDIVLIEPSAKDAGPLELPEAMAVALALENRPDLRVAQGQVYDAQRKVVVAADALQAGLTLTASGAAGSRRGIGSTAAPDAELRPEKGTYSAGLALDLPLHRTAERNAYRSSLISLERATRAFQQLEDEVKLAIRSRLRDLLESRESLKTQAQSVVVAQRRVAMTNQFLQAGRIEIRDVLDAQTALVNAQNAFTSALVGYRVAELQMQRDLGLLEVNQEGLWREYLPKQQRQ